MAFSIRKNLFDSVLSSEKDMATKMQIIMMHFGNGDKLVCRRADVGTERE